jgi:hypothetical protein
MLNLRDTLYMCVLSSVNVRHGTYLVISQETLCLSVRTRVTSASFLVNVRANIVVAISLTKGEGASIERDAHH